MITLPRLQYKTACSTLQPKLWTMQNDWWTELDQKSQRNADTGDMSAFYEARKAVYGSSHPIQAPRRSSDGNALLTDKKAIHLRWPEHLEGLFTDHHIMQESLLAKIIRVDVKLELDDLSTREEIKKATMQLKVGKSPGIDGISAGVYQQRGEIVLDKLQDLFTS